MKKLLLAVLLLGAVVPTQAQIKRVAGQVGGASACSNGAATKTLPGNVTAGNTVVFSTFLYLGTATNVTKTGTAVLGSFVKDVTVSGTVSGNATITSIWRAPVTTSGTLTLSATGGSCNGLTVQEYSGIAASPVDITDINTGTSATETTHPLTTKTSGELIVQSSVEASNVNFTYVQNGTNIWNDALGATQFTFQSQDLLTTSTGPNTLTASTGNNWAWTSIAVAYTAAAPAVATGTPLITSVVVNASTGLSCGVPGSSTGQPPPPPPPPTRNVVLSWVAPNPVGGSGVLAGYNVYRNGAKINSTLVVSATFTDLSLLSGSYAYVVTAVDTAGSESAPSNTANASF